MAGPFRTNGNVATGTPQKRHAVPKRAGLLRQDSISVTENTELATWRLQAPYCWHLRSFNQRLCGAHPLDQIDIQYRAT